MRKDVIADMRRELMRRSMVGTITDKDRDVVECFIVDFEHERGLR